MKPPFNKPYLTGKETHYIFKAVYEQTIGAGAGVTKDIKESGVYVGSPARKIK